MDSPVEHWNEVYATRAVDDVSWYQDNPATSVRLLKAFSAPSDPIVDVGAGASTLVDVLVRDGWRDITVLDVSGTALDLVPRSSRGRCMVALECMNAFHH